jgi:uncharacterized protein
MKNVLFCIMVMCAALALIAGPGCGKKGNPAADNKLLMCEDVECLKAALAEGANVNALSQSGDTKLLFVAADGKVDMAKLLIEKGAEINFAGKTLKETALHKAVIYNRIEVVKLLIEKKAKLSLVAGNNFTPLKRAQSDGFKEIEKLLVAAGAKE